MTGDAFRALRDRLSAFEESGDEALLADPRVPDELAGLRRSIGWPGSGALPGDPDIRRRLDEIVLLGTFTWLRAHTLPEADQLDARLEAAELLAAAYAVAPESLPRRMARVIAGPVRGARGEGHADMHDHAVDLLAAAGPENDLAGVDDAIWLMSFAARAAAGDRFLPYYLSDLGTAWLNRYRITRRDADLDHSVAAHEQALATPVPAAEDQAGRLAGYSTALLARFARDRDERDLDGAVAAARSAARLAATAEADQARAILARQLPAGDQVVAVRLARLASLERLSVALLAAFEQHGERADLDEAVDAAAKAARLVPPGDPSHARCQAVLAMVRQARYQRFGEAADLPATGTSPVPDGAVPRQPPAPEGRAVPPDEPPPESAVVPFRRRGR